MLNPTQTVSHYQSESGVNHMKAEIHPLVSVAQVECDGETVWENNFLAHFGPLSTN